MVSGATQDHRGDIPSEKGSERSPEVTGVGITRLRSP